jgi:hypothetical protein
VRVVLHLANGTFDGSGKYRQPNHEHKLLGFGMAFEIERHQFWCIARLDQLFFLPLIRLGAGEIELKAQGCARVRKRFVAHAGEVVKLDIELRAK